MTLLSRVYSMRFVLLIHLLCAMGGCATWGDKGMATGRDGFYRVSVAPVGNIAPIATLADIMTVPPDQADDQARLAEQIRTVEQHLTANLADALVGSVNLRLASPTELNAGGALMRLEVQVVAYGKLEKKWQWYLIGSGVAEGLMQGVLAAGVTRNPWVGLVVATEEIAQETLLWTGGAGLFNKYFTPVSLQARLVDVVSGAEIWTDHVFVAHDADAIGVLPDAQRQWKELQLQLTADKALRELVADLDGAASDNLRWERAADSDLRWFDGEVEAWSGVSLQ